MHTSVVYKYIELIPEMQGTFAASGYTADPTLGGNGMKNYSSSFRHHFSRGNVFS